MRLIAILFCFSVLVRLGWAQQVQAQKAAVQSTSATPVPMAAALRFTPQHVAIRPPTGWQETPVPRGNLGTLARFVAPNAFGATLSLAYSEDPGRSRLPDELPALIATALAKRYPGFQLLSKQRLAVQGADAWLLDGQVKTQGHEVTVRNRQVYFCREGRVYIVTLTCKKEDFERLAPSLDRLLKTLEWVDER